MEWIRFGFAALFISIGLLLMILETIGVYRYDFVLNRMHSAAMGDTLGLLFSLLGLVVLWGFSFASLKLMLVVMMLWISSPVSSHLISRLEVTTDEELEKHCEVKK